MKKTKCAILSFLEQEGSLHRVIYKKAYKKVLFSIFSSNLDLLVSLVTVLANLTCRRVGLAAGLHFQPFLKYDYVGLTKEILRSAKSFPLSWQY
jgi:hypothetical protein